MASRPVSLEDMPFTAINDHVLNELLRCAREQPDQVSAILAQVNKLRDRLCEQNINLYHLYGNLEGNRTEDLERYEEYTRVMDRVEVAFEVLDDTNELNLSDLEKVEGTVRILQPVVAALNYIQTSYGEYNNRSGEQLVIEANKLQFFVHLLNQRNYEIQEYFMLTFLNKDEPPPPHHA